MRNILLVVEYEGTNYCGWQTQPNGETVQACLERALSSVTNHEVRIMGSGRTDSGVHAEGQTATFTTTSGVPLRALVSGVNSLLPPDISVKSAVQAPDWLDARRSTLIKTYRYRIYNDTARSATEARRAWWVARPLNVAAMDEAAKFFAGTHDFGGFRASGCDAAHAVRTIASSRVTRRGLTITYEISGNGFLRNMVRMIAGTLVDVGLGKLSPEEVAAIIASGGAQKGGPTAPAEGLTLLHVAYPHFEGERFP